jgi:hypothetical protein
MAPRKAMNLCSTQTKVELRLGSSESREKAGQRNISDPYVAIFAEVRAELLMLNFTVLQPGLISQANGSAYVETDRTKVACAV